MNFTHTSVQPCPYRAWLYPYWAHLSVRVGPVDGASRMRCSPRHSSAYWAFCLAIRSGAFTHRSSFGTRATASGAAQRELARLEESGLLVGATNLGHQKHYQANAASPLYSELLNIVLKTVGLAEPLRDALKPIVGDSRGLRVRFRSQGNRPIGKRHRLADHQRQPQLRAVLVALNASRAPWAGRSTCTRLTRPPNFRSAPGPKTPS